MFTVCGEYPVGSSVNVPPMVLIVTVLPGKRRTVCGVLPSGPTPVINMPPVATNGVADGSSVNAAAMPVEASKKFLVTYVTHL